MRRVRVLVLDDSLICRVQLREILEAEGDIEVVGEAANGDRVLELIRQTRPQLLVVDLQMPGTGGQETIELVMAKHPLPILVVSGQPEGVRRTAVFESIRRGALDLAAKPGPSDRAAAASLRALVRQLSALPVVRHMKGNIASGRAAPTPVPKLAPASQPLQFARDFDRSEPPIVGIAASAGGPLALAALLRELSATDFPGAVAVVQHLPNGFAQAFVEFLQGRQALPVVLVHGRVAIRRGVLYLAADDQHLIAADAHSFAPSADPPDHGHRPSGDALLHSLARVFGPRAAGVVLSGIGQDGAAGLGAMRERGALTFAQDQGSAAVYGMPRKALETGAATYAMDPVGIARALREWASDRRGARP